MRVAAGIAVILAFGTAILAAIWLGISLSGGPPPCDGGKTGIERKDGLVIHCYRGDVYDVEGLR